MHILLVPKKAIGSLVDLKKEDNVFLFDLFRIAKLLVEELEIGQTGYRLILNGGEYQEVPQMHFHLVSGTYAPEPEDIENTWPPEQRNDI